MNSIKITFLIKPFPNKYTARVQCAYRDLLSNGKEYDANLDTAYKPPAQNNISQSFWQHARMVRTVTSRIIAPSKGTNFLLAVNENSQNEGPSYITQTLRTHIHSKNTQSFLENAHDIIRGGDLLFYVFYGIKWK